MTISAYMDLAIRLANIASDYPEDHRHRKTCMEAGDVLAELEQDSKPIYTPTTVPQEHSEPMIVAAVLVATGARTGVDVAMLRDRTRRGSSRRVAHARAIACYILNRKYNVSTPNLVKHFRGGKGHTCIVEAALRFERALATDKPYLDNRSAREWLAAVQSAITL